MPETASATSSPLGELFRKTREALAAATAQEGGDRGARAEQAFRAALDASGIQPVEPGGYDCPACSDDGFVLDATAEGVEFLRPCQACRPALYERFKAGHFSPDHSCPECDKLAGTTVTKRAGQQEGRGRPPGLVSHAELSQPRERDDEPHEMF